MEIVIYIFNKSESKKFFKINQRKKSTRKNERKM